MNETTAQLCPERKTRGTEMKRGRVVGMMGAILMAAGCRLAGSRGVEADIVVYGLSLIHI